MFLQKYVFSHTCMALQPRRRWYKQFSTCKTSEIYIDCLLKWRSSVFSLTSLLIFEPYIGEFEVLRFATGSVNDRY
jgi:hypothetical protein